MSFSSFAVSVKFLTAYTINYDYDLLPKELPELHQEVRSITKFRAVSPPIAILSPHVATVEPIVAPPVLAPSAIALFLLAKVTFVAKIFAHLTAIDDFSK